MSERERPTNMLCTGCGSPMEDDTVPCFHCGQERRRVTLTRGTVIADRYELLRVLGHGGMGSVYEVTDRYLEERLALKVLSGSALPTSEASRRFRDEIRLARRIRHPNVCAIHEYGEVGDLQYIVMELVRGLDLKQALAKRGPMPPEEAAALVGQIAAGLQAIHDAGVVHRDLKPANIMLSESGPIRLMDFGIAKGFGEAGATTSGQVVGTPEYMSPEQAQGRILDARSDVYALAILTYELLTGDVPFKAPTVLATIMLHVSGTPTFEHPALSPEIAEVLRRGLAKVPEERPASALEFARQFEAATRGQSLSESIPAAPTGAAAAESRKVDSDSILPPSPLALAPAKRPVSARTALVAAAVVVIGGFGLRAWVGPGPQTSMPTESAPVEPSPNAPSTKPPEPGATRSDPVVGAASVAHETPAPGVPSARPDATPLQAAGARETPSAPAPATARPATVAPAAEVAPTPAASPEPASPPGSAAPTGGNSETSQLQIGARPFARVFVDGEDAGLLPLKPLSLPPGRHVVRLIHPDYQPIQRILTLKPGETARLFIDFSLDGVPR